MDKTEYLRPNNLKELGQVMTAHKNRATIIAGGTNLIPQMRDGDTSPELIVDINDIPDFSFITEDDGYISIGAATTIAKIASSDIVSTFSPILASAARELGNPQIRNRATIGGNLANASPCADTAPSLLALEAVVRILSPGGKTRDVALNKFFHGYKFTDLGKGEVITRFFFPKPHDATTGSQTKIGLRNAAAISVSGIAVMLTMKGKICKKARIAVGSVAPIPMRVSRVEQLLEGQEISATLLEQCKVIVKKDISPISDIRGSSKYRSYVTAVILERNIKRALSWEK